MQFSLTLKNFKMDLKLKNIFILFLIIFTTSCSPEASDSNENYQILDKTISGSSASTSLRDFCHLVDFSENIGEFKVVQIKSMYEFDIYYNEHVPYTYITLEKINMVQDSNPEKNEITVRTLGGLLPNGATQLWRFEIETNKNYILFITYSEPHMSGFVDILDFYIFEPQSGASCHNVYFDKQSKILSNFETINQKTVNCSNNITVNFDQIDLTQELEGCIGHEENQ
jgi:hypothetical protein